MHLHILGICGTFMGGLALIARELGYSVSGSDANVYPPMSTQLSAAGITLHEGYDAAALQPAPDVVVIGNALSRGNPAVEYVLTQKLSYISGPQWLAEQVLGSKHVLALSGTHGKTTTSSMLAWILETAGLQPGFLIGGVPLDFGVSARLGQGECFVIEADEYDSAFFDKRSKFIHYRPETLVINNIEFDHADIFRDLEDIRRQFQFLLRTVPGSGQVIARADDAEIDTVLARGCWSAVSRFGLNTAADWQANLLKPDASEFDVLYDNQTVGQVRWSLLGTHNAENALAAIAAAHAVGVAPGRACEALGQFRNVRRRLETLAVVNGITVYDDFAHHPTAIALTLDGLRKRVGTERILAILEPRSNTMRMGVHKDTLLPALALADACWLYQPAGLDWQLNGTARVEVLADTGAIIAAVASQAQAGDHILIMSNGGFENIHQRLIEQLRHG
ncbi:MAG: UDP-N-acetylmuramate:L-alanyl-gamma-D-glutamyl-meso-diaminopimelate ligase [Gammaproteobacteria bacterium]